MYTRWRLRGAHSAFHRLYSTMAEPLVPLPPVEKLSSRVIRVLAGNPGKVSVGLIRELCIYLTDSSSHCKVGRRPNFLKEYF